jgi:hypothetical protein
MKKLLSVSADAKTVKGQKYGYLTAILYLAPVNVAGFGNVCPKASKGCSKACLYSAGRGQFNSVQKSRIEKTQRYFQDRENFFDQLDKEIHAMKRKAQKLGFKPAVRLNGTSDLLSAYHIELIQKHPDVQFYDYTKVSERFYIDLPINYHLTFSRSERNERECLNVLSLGFNVAIVFKQLPIEWNGYKVINGDESDIRFNDDKGIVIGLTAKGKARKDETGFVI